MIRMKTNVLLKRVAAGFVLVLAARAQALSYTANGFTFPDTRGGSTDAYGINDSGVVAGNYSVYYVTEGYGYTYKSGSFAAFNAPDSSGAYGGTFAIALNNSGSVAGGYYSTTLSREIGFIYNGIAYTPVDATSLNHNQTTVTHANGINDSNLVVGSFTDYATGAKQSFIDNGGVLFTISAPGAVQTSANGINNAGQVVGSFLDSNNQVHGFIFSGSTYTVLNAPNATNTYLQSISNSGQILGNYTDATGSHDFVLSNNVFESVDIPNLAASEFSLYGINSSGQIVGTAYGSSSGDYGFVLTPVPLVATAWLLSSGLFGLAGLHRCSKVLHRI